MTTEHLMTSNERSTDPAFLTDCLRRCCAPPGWTLVELCQWAAGRLTVETGTDHASLAKRWTALADLYEREGIAPGVIELARESALALHPKTSDGALPQMVAQQAERIRNQLEAEHPPEKTIAKRTDTQRLDELEALVAQGDCPGIINDDNGHWAVSGSGVQSVSAGPEPVDTSTAFFVPACLWRNSIREAIDAYLDDGDDDDNEIHHAG